MACDICDVSFHYKCVGIPREKKKIMIKSFSRKFEIHVGKKTKMINNITI